MVRGSLIGYRKYQNLAALFFRALRTLCFSFHQHPPGIAGRKAAYRPGKEKNKQEQIALVGIDKRIEGFSTSFRSEFFHHGLIDTGPAVSAESAGAKGYQQ